MNLLEALSAVGNAADLPASMARDAFMLRNPLDQLLTPTSHVNRVTGADILRAHGIIGRRPGVGNTLAGIGTELAFDPLTYVGVGAFKKAPQLLQALMNLRP